MTFEQVIWHHTPKGKLGFLMCYDWNKQSLHYFVGVGDGLNDHIDINHIYNSGVKLPAEAGVAIFFGSWE